MSHLKRILGYNQQNPVTHLNVTPATPEPSIERQAREATKAFVTEKWAAERSAEEVRRQLASGALRLVVHHHQGN